LEPIAGCCRYVPFHRGLQVSIDGHPGDSDVNLETFVLFLFHTPARFYLSVELRFIVCFLHFMYICHARHYSTLRNVHYWKRRRRRWVWQIWICVKWSSKHRGVCNASTTLQTIRLHVEACRLERVRTRFMSRFEAPRKNGRIAVHISCQRKPDRPTM